MTDKPTQPARILWNYLKLNQSIGKADCILVMCSHDLRVADYAAGLFLEGWAPLLVFSGGMAHQGDLLETGWGKAEADIFAQRAESLGVPGESILRETQAENSGENIILSDTLLRENGYHPKSFIIVQKPYMERRAWATVKAQRPEWQVCVTSPSMSFDEYPLPEKGITLDKVINIMVGDFQRIKEYPDKGFQIPQDIPEEVEEAWRMLIDAGYHRHART